MKARPVLLLLLSFGFAGHLTAQVRAPFLESLDFRPPPSGPSHSCASAITPSLLCTEEHLARAPDHRYEGMAVGAAIGAGLGVLIGLWACEQAGDGSCAGDAVVGGVGGAALLGFVGMMIGAQFPKEPGPAPRDSAAAPR